jgi:hypothetical protein
MNMEPNALIPILQCALLANAYHGNLVSVMSGGKDESEYLRSGTLTITHTLRFLPPWMASMVLQRLPPEDAAEIFTNNLNGRLEVANWLCGMDEEARAAVLGQANEKVDEEKESEIREDVDYMMAFNNPPVEETNELTRFQDVWKYLNLDSKTMLLSLAEVMKNGTAVNKDDGDEKAESRSDEKKST